MFYTLSPEWQKCLISRYMVIDRIPPRLLEKLVEICHIQKRLKPGGAILASEMKSSQVLASIIFMFDNRVI